MLNESSFHQGGSIDVHDLISNFYSLTREAHYAFYEGFSFVFWKKGKTTIS